jgi:23S rRNA pseudouridine1911/1915/1917 synthase
MKILYEDKALIVVVKEPGQLSEAADGSPDSLITALNQHFRAEGQSATAYPIHRLDRNVGGVMVYAKTKAAAGKLSASVQENKLVKEYLATVYGTPDPREGTMEDRLWKDVRKNKTFVVKRMRKGVKPASLDYRVVAEEEGRSLVRIRLHTGRSHQIRVQFASRRHPLVGDGKYGAKDNAPLALFSCRLTFPHPFRKETLSFEAKPEELGGFPLDKVE